MKECPVSSLSDAPVYLTFDDLTVLPRRNKGSPEAVSLAERVSRRHRLGFPVLSAGMPSVTEQSMAIAMGQFGGLGVIHRYCSIEKQCEMVAAVASHVPDRGIYKDASVREGGALLASASCAPVDLERARALASAGARLLFLDTPNPPNDEVFAGVARMRQALPEVDLVIGSVVETDTARRYLELGIDAIKVGLGAGALCSIRRTAGVGAPQVTALEDVCVAARDYGVPVISDGGISCSGDIVKALAVGASAVMLGSLLASCDEAPGAVVEVNGKRMKEIAGLRLSDLEIDGPTGYPAVDAYLREHAAPRVEGGDARIPASGPCHLTLLRLLRGVRVGVHMAGALNLEELRRHARLVRVSPSGVLEANAAGSSA
ncbi:guanosine monophosphate reductase [Archangium minus]|uniref:Guanosine monophosphate reductase n=1 Tax=Archangium minus TaxID=83450 RepID=A0ABY9WSL5_9BACT|nr:guanosine monophosphate reductase [Archangium minus]